MNIRIIFSIIFSRIECDLSKPLDLETRGERDFFLQLVYIGLLHFCNFSALNYFFKSMIATVCAIIVLFLYSPLTCHISTPLSSLQASSWNCSGGDVAVKNFQQGKTLLLVDQQQILSLLYKITALIAILVAEEEASYLEKPYSVY